jgi:hypothetical protein
VVLREFLFRVDKVLEVFGDDLFELVKRNEGRLDVVGLVVRSGHPEAEECPSGVDGVRVLCAVEGARRPRIGGGELPGVVGRRYA